MSVPECGGKPMRSEKTQKQIYINPFNAVLAALIKHKVQYIVIGGQAVVVYGASQFTRDADFWINPTKINLNRLKKALKELKTTPRFLPPLKLSYLKKGHGVHFRFSYKGHNFLIDILGKPPRVSGFLPAWKNAEPIQWHGLKIPVLDIRRLVDTKKTNRERDYLVIQSLTELVFENAIRNKSTQKLVAGWLAKESRNPSHLKMIARTWKNGKKVLLESKRPAAILAAQGATVPQIKAELEIEKERLKKENIEYWRPLIHELRRLRQLQRKK